MNSARRLTLSFVLSASVTVGAFAGGFQLNEHGARAMAQAGAFAARASDPSAMYFNPAGLSFIDQVTVYGGLTAIVPTSSFFGPNQYGTDAKTVAPSQYFTPINVYASIPVMNRLTIGLGVNNPFGLGSIWPDDWSGRYLTTNVQLQTFYYTGSLSYRLLDNLSIAASFSYVHGSVTLDRAVAIPLQAASGEPKVHLDLAGHSTGWSAGALYKLSPEYSVGASYHSSVKLDASGSAAFTPNYTGLGLPQGDVSSSLTLPSTGFIGFAWTPAEKPFQIEADYQYIGWSAYDKLNFAFKADGSSIVQVKNYKNSYILRIGGEYTCGNIHWRAGYLYDHTPVDAAHVDPMLPDANRNGFNIGLGYDLTKNLSVDVAYMYLPFNERTAENTDYAFDGVYHTRVNLYAIDLGYKF